MKDKSRKGLLFFTLIFIIAFALSACGEGEKERSPYEKYSEEASVEYGLQVINKISSLGDDPATGNRSAGSPAEKEAADYILQQMEDIGLENVTVDKVKVDGWTYKGANLTFIEADGSKVRIDLGGYATDLQVADEDLDILYLGQGREADYDGVDVKDKLVLIDIDQNNEWWITYPAFQAKVKGAKAVLAFSIMEEEDGERLGSQDICGPKDAPVFAISKKDSDILKNAIKKSANKSIKVTFNADSSVKEDSQTQNIWGEIPGKTDETILIISHYDGYYHSSFDNAQGVSQVLAIAKALKSSGYEPEKTLRFVAHGAEEWGLTDYEADWAIGAWMQIKENHPEWAESAFALINLDGSYTLEGVEEFGIETSNELTKFTKESLGDFIDDSNFEFAWTEMPNPYREDFGYSLAGIPAIAATNGLSEKYDAFSYHQSTDSIDAVGFNEDAYEFLLQMYGKLIFDLDNLSARPMDFGARFEAFKESLDKNVIDDEELIGLIDEHIALSAQISDKIADINKNGEDATEFNKELFKAFKEIQDEYLRLNWWLETIFPHENAQSNILAFNDAIASLEGGDVDAALEILYDVEFGYNASAFDKETCDYFIERMEKESHSGVSWNYKRVENTYSNVDDVIRSLIKKNEGKISDYQKEIKLLDDMIDIQEDYIKTFVKSEKESLTRTLKTLKELI